MTRRAKTTTTPVMTSGLAGLDPRALAQAPQHKGLGHDHLLGLGRFHTLVGGVDAGSSDVLRAPQLTVDGVRRSQGGVGNRGHARALALIAANSSSVIAPLSSSALAWDSCSTDEDVEPDEAVTLRM